MFLPKQDLLCLCQILGCNLQETVPFVTLAFYTSPLSHTIIEWPGSDRTFRIIQVQPHSHGREAFHHTRLLKAPSSLTLNTSRHEASGASLGSLCQCLTSLIVNFPLICKPTPFQSEVITPCPIAASPWEKFLHSSLVSLLQVLEGALKSPQSLLLGQTKKPQLSQPVFKGEVPQPSDHPCSTPWMQPIRDVSFLCWGPQSWT